MESIDVLGELSRLVAEGAVSEDALSAMTRIEAARLHAALVEDRPGPATMISAGRQVFTTDETMRISMLAGQLTGGMEVADDERLTSILETLVAEMRLTPANIAELTGVTLDDVMAALSDPRSVPPEVKYALGLRTSYLITAINMARGR